MRRQISRRKRFFLSASVVIVCTSGATLSYFGLWHASEPFQMAALACVAGLLTLSAVEDILEEAHESREDTKSSTLAFLRGLRAVHRGVGGASIDRPGCGEYLDAWNPG